MPSQMTPASSALFASLRARCASDGGKVPGKVVRTKTPDLALSISGSWPPKCNQVRFEDVHFWETHQKEQKTASNKNRNSVLHQTKNKEYINHQPKKLRKKRRKEGRKEGRQDGRKEGGQEGRLAFGVFCFFVDK